VPRVAGSFGIGLCRCVPLLLLATVPVQAADDPRGSAVEIFYDKGLFIESADGNWSAHPQLRAQFRY